MLVGNKKKIFTLVFLEKKRLLNEYKKYMTPHKPVQSTQISNDRSIQLSDGMFGSNVHYIPVTTVVSPQYASP